MRTHRDDKWFWGMAMSRKGKVLFVWILVVALGFFFSHFWGCAVYALEKAVALSFVSLPSVGKLAAGMTAGSFFLTWIP